MYPNDRFAKFRSQNGSFSPYKGKNAPYQQTSSSFARPRTGSYADDLLRRQQIRQEQRRKTFESEGNIRFRTSESSEKEILAGGTRPSSRPGSISSQRSASQASSRQSNSVVFTPRSSVASSVNYNRPRTGSYGDEFSARQSIVGFFSPHPHHQTFIEFFEPT